MPITPNFPTPAMSRCPVCAGDVAGGSCTGCLLRLDGEGSQALFWVAGELHRLSQQRERLLPAIHGTSEGQGPDLFPAGAVFAPPAIEVCPGCDGPVALGRCGRCGLDLEGDVGSSLWTIDTELHRLTAQRSVLVERARAQAQAVAPVGAGVGGSVATAPSGFPWPTGSVPAPAPVPAGERVGPPPPPVGRPVAEAPAAAGGGHTLQYLLLGLGALCLVVAAIAFGAVAWTRMGAVAKGAVLAGGTVAAAGAAVAAQRRRLQATAEAIATVAVASAIVDIHAVQVGFLAQTPGWQVWSIGLAVVAGLAWALDRVVPLVSARIGAIVVAQTPVIVLAAGPEWSDAWMPAALLVGQAAATFALVRLAQNALRPRWLVTLPLVGATLCWSSATLIALIGSTFDDDLTWSTGWGSVVVLGAAAMVAAGVAWAWSRIDVVRVLASAAASTLTIAVAMLALADRHPVGPWWVVAAWAGAGVAVLGLALPERFRATPAVIGTTVAGLASLGGLDGWARACLALTDVSHLEPWSVDAVTSVRHLAHGVSEHDLRVGLVALVPTVAVGAAAWWRRLARPVVTVGVGFAVLLASILAPLAYGWPVWAAAALPLALGLLLLAVAAEVPSTRLVAGPLGAVGLAIAACWASVAPAVTVGALAISLGLALLLAERAGRRGDTTAAGASGLVAATATLGLALSVPAVRGAAAVEGWTVAALVFAATSFAGWLLALRATRSTADDNPAQAAAFRSLSLVAEISALVVHGLALAVVADAGDLGRTALVLLAGGVTFAAHAARVERRWLVWPALAEGLALLWLRLADAHVVVVEAYTLPLAAVLLAAGARSLLRSADRGSWDTLGPGLALALAPTVVLAVTGVDGARTLVGLVAGTAVLLVGVRGRFQSAVTIGACAVGAVALRELIPAASGLPRFVVFAAVGAVLLAVGATFEQRRRDLVELKDRFGSLR